MAGNYCVASAGQYKALINTDPVFELDLSDPCDSAPTGEIEIGSSSSPLTFIMQSKVKVLGLEDGRRKLIIESMPETPLAGRHGAASVVSNSISWSCRVQSYEIPDTTTNCAILAEPLPKDLPIGEDVYLSFRYVYAELPEQVEPVKNCLLTIHFEPFESAKRGVSSLTFLVSYVRQIFTTGVTETDLRAYYYTLSSQPASDAGISNALQMGEDELVTELRKQLMDRGLCEDDIPAASSLRQAHLLYSAACFFRLSDTEAFDHLIAQARRSCEIEIRRIWVDADKNGKPDDSKKLADRSGDTAFICQRPLAKPQRGWWPCRRLH